MDELGNIKSTDFGPRGGGFNLLNTPDELYKTPNQFWEEYNQPWLDNAIARNDIIYLATEPIDSNLFRINKLTGERELTGFGKEFQYLKALDDAVSSGKTIKFSHNPSLKIYKDSALADEWSYLKTNYGFKTLKEVGGFWIAN